MAREEGGCFGGRNDVPRFERRRLLKVTFVPAPFARCYHSRRTFCAFFSFILRCTCIFGMSLLGLALHRGGEKEIVAEIESGRRSFLL